MPEHFITLKEAKELTATYMARKANILNPVYGALDILPNCETFDRAAIDAILAQTECTQIRVYYGMDANLAVHSIIVGVDANGDDLLPTDPDAPNQQIMENAGRCPTICPRNPL